MSSNRIFDVTGFIGLGNNDLGYDNSSTVGDLLNAYSWKNSTGLGLYTRQYASSSTQNHEWYLRPSSAGGPSQPYTGVEVRGDLNSSLDLTGPASAPTAAGCPLTRVSTLPTLKTIVQRLNHSLQDITHHPSSQL